MIPLTFAAVQTAVPFFNLVIGTTAMSLNINAAQKLKNDLQELEQQNKQASERYKQLESEKNKLAKLAEPTTGRMLFFF
ncbi:hypothetical protein BC833DRAFT_594223 [Globomyces pollinis-pini]|nr:hypothetical protein BC833DRAFT_594223 [Globomyces pollinis-pini]KAJ2987241.1 hypothetical protein HDV02_006284 [Globomyces sp. JEL0801]KAJ2987458.1 hypothetical protein HDV02_006119 [Globomyces sp. JEL0801]